MTRPLVAALTVALVALIAAGCAAGRAASSSEVIVFAAASLTEPITEAADVYAGERPGSAITLSFGSSAALRTQIEHGAPADVFLSADTANPERLADAGLADGSAVPFARNDLVVIVPAASEAVTTAADLARRGVSVVAAGDEVPITTYADELVCRLAGLPGYPPGFAERYAANVVSREDDVKAVVAKIQLGEADAAIVYRTDALAAEAVRTVALPDRVDVVATYAGVVIRASRARSEARRFLEWLTGPSGQVILGRAGFLPPR